MIGTTFTLNDTNPIHGRLVRSRIFDREGERIGVLSVESEKMREEASVPEDFGIAQDEIIIHLMTEITELAYENVNKIILLSKSTLPEVDEYYIKKIPYIDIIVASYKGKYYSNNEDVVIGTLLGSYPKVIENNGLKSLIVSPPAYGVGIGRLDVTFDVQGNIIDFGSNSDSYILDNSYAPQVPDSLGLEVHEFTRAFFDDIQARGQSVITITDSFIDGSRDICRTTECTGGSLIADSVREFMDTDIALINAGSIRASIDAGDVTYGDIISLQPFKNTIVTFSIRGDQLVYILEHGLSEFFASNSSARLLHVSGMKYSWNPELPLGERITGIEILDSEGRSSRINFDQVYTASTAEFLFTGGDNFDFSNATDAISGGQDLQGAVIQILQAKPSISLENIGRISENSEPYIFRDKIHNARVDYRTPVVIVTFIFLAIPIGISIFLFIKRDHAVVVIASPFFCHLINFGAIMVYLGLIFYTFIINDAGCMLLPWLVTLGFSMMYGCLFAKTWRIHSIFSRQRKMKITKKPINNRQLFTVLGLMLLVDMIILAIWQGISPHTNEILPTDEIQVFNEVCRSDNGIYFFITILVVKALLLVWGMYLVYLTRQIDSDFRESTFIGFIIYSVSITLVVIIAVAFIISSDYTIVFFLTSVAIWIVPLATVLGLFVPKIVDIVQQPDLLWENYFKRRATNISNRNRGSTLGVSQDTNSSFQSTYSSGASLKKDLKKMKKKDKERLLAETKEKEKSLATELESTKKDIVLINAALQKKN